MISLRKFWRLFIKCESMICKNIIKWILIVTGLILLGLVYRQIKSKVTRFDLPKGELKWSLTRPQNAKMCIPAAFTRTDGKIWGAYRYDGKTYQANKRLITKVSLKDDMFYISKKWLSDNGFQQYPLVYNSKPMKSYDSRKTIRRALCKDKNGAFILESNYPMTLSDFALECSKRSTNAVYLDMGEYGFGYIKTKFFVRPLHIWGFFSRHKQTNWLYVE